jgi:hypothetical protein
MTEFAARIAKLLVGEPSETKEQRTPLAKNDSKHHGRRSVVPYVSLIAFACVLVGISIWLRRNSQGQQKTADLPTSTQAQVDNLLARANVATEASPKATSKEALAAAGSMLAQAESLDPMNGEIWAREALNNLEYVRIYYDDSADRKTQIIAEVDRAMALSPASFEARLAHALEIYYIVRTDGSLPLAESELKRLLDEHPSDKTVMSALGLVLRNEQRPKEAAAVLMKADRPAEAAWEYLHSGDWRAMDRAADLALKQEPLNIDPKIQVELYGYEDLDAVRRIIDAFPPQEMIKDYPFSVALHCRFMLREPQKILDIASSFPREWISCWYYLEPKALWEGNAFSMLGRKEAANAKWRIALKQIQDRLASTPDDAHLVLLLSDAESALGDNDAATASIRLYDQLRGTPEAGFYGDEDLRWIAVKLRLGQKDEALKKIEPKLRNPEMDSWSFHGQVRFRPDLDPLRSDPSFQMLMRETKPDVAKPFD